MMTGFRTTGFMGTGLKCALAVAALGAATLLPLANASAENITRINTLTKSCDYIRGVLIDEGAAILRWPSTRVKDLILYDRYVGDSRLCREEDVGRLISIPARDTAKCQVIACEVPITDDDGLFFGNRPLIVLRR